MRILLTNDDGIGAQGLQTLRRELRRIEGVTLDVIAPDSNRSASARSITVRSPLSIQELRFEDGDLGHATDGTPVDCVRFASVGLLGGRPDVIVSGINHGVNLGDDVTYSGTVAGAMEGAIMGVPSVAFSLLGRESSDFAPAAELAASVARWVLLHGLPARTLLNVNVPDTQGKKVPGFRWTRAGLRDYGHAVVVQKDPRGRSMYWIGSEIGFHTLEGSDCNAVHEGLAAVTPIYLDMTHHELLGTLALQELPGFERR